MGGRDESKEMIVHCPGYGGEGMHCKALVVRYPGYGGVRCSVRRW